MRLIITSLVAGLALAAGGSAGSNTRECVERYGRQAGEPNLDYWDGETS